jgi:hypothetical protein
MRLRAAASWTSVVHAFSQVPCGVEEASDLLIRKTLHRPSQQVAGGGRRCPRGGGDADDLARKSPGDELRGLDFHRRGPWPAVKGLAGLEFSFGSVRGSDGEPDHDRLGCLIDRYACLSELVRATGGPRCTAHSEVPRARAKRALASCPRPASSRWLRSSPTSRRDRPVPSPSLHSTAPAAWPSRRVAVRKHPIVERQ